MLAANPQSLARLSELSDFLASTAGLAGDIYADHSGLLLATRNDAAPALELIDPWMRLLQPASLTSSDSYLLASAVKGPDKDRQVVDRMGRAWAESRLRGPGLFIPIGPLLGMLEINPARQIAKIFITSCQRLVLRQPLIFWGRLYPSGGREHSRLCQPCR